ncbi:mediator complex, subunit Med18 [Chaetomium sp. MPI-SDFR-AT-0129]|nr:mediator complex, subunit Med18 [Chaetomium sp. MPI-SDFR-AT-0129]
MTHESFLAASVLDDDGVTARSILSGITESRERHSFTRIQHYRPQAPTAQGLTTIKQLQKERRPTTPRWQELHQILVKQPSVVQVRTDITPEVENAMSGAATGDDAPLVEIPGGKPCALRWVDLPDPPSPQRPPFITQRRVVDIDDPRAPTILAESKFGLKSDLIEESYSWWFEGIEYCLTRFFNLPANPDSNQNPDPAAPKQVPNPASLRPVGNIWILYISAKVDATPAATMPDRVKQAHARLVGARDQLKGVFEFPAFDRRSHDTRVSGTRAP